MSHSGEPGSVSLAVGTAGQRGSTTNPANWFWREGRLFLTQRDPMDRAQTVSLTDNEIVALMVDLAKHLQDRHRQRQYPTRDEV